MKQTKPRIHLEFYYLATMTWYYYEGMHTENVDVVDILQCLVKTAAGCSAACDSQFSARRREGVDGALDCPLCLSIVVVGILLFFFPLLKT